ncbi:MAG: hypothetical protein ACKODX_20690 [Gemmata sp.]
MPIRFRCHYCNRLLGIATRKAGTETTCPHCGYTITVPVPAQDDAKTERLDMDDVDRLLGNAVTDRVSEPAGNARQQAAPGAGQRNASRAPPPSAQEPISLPPDSRQPAKPQNALSATPQLAKAGPSPKPSLRSSDDPPLFEGDVDEILGNTAAPVADERPKPPPTSGQDAMSLGDPPKMLVISAQKATLALGGVVVLLGLAFATGYFLAR